MELLSRRHFGLDEAINLFYNHIPRQCNSKCGDCNYSWEITNDGFYLHGKSSISFFRFNDATIFRLMKWFHKDDMNLLKDLNILSQENKNFRIETLIDWEIVEVENVTYLYYISQRPNREFGTTGFEELLSVDRMTFFKEFIEQYSILLPYVDYLTKKYGFGPSVKQLNFNSSRAKDSIGHYWKDIRLFKLPTDQIIEESKKILKTAVSMTTPTNIEAILSYADERWQI